MDDSAMTGAGAAITEDLFTLEELTELALDADLDATLDADARPLVMTASSEALLPLWYMPAASARISPGWRRWIIVALVAVLFGIEFSGLCSVFGQLVVG
jgi:hypothetical protein